MKKLLALTLALGAVALAGCGSDSGSCSTATAAVAPPSGDCANLQADADVTVVLRGAQTPGQCQTCAETSPTCAIDALAATQVHLDTQYRQCEDDRGCGSGCVLQQPQFLCRFHTPAASSPSMTLFFNNTSAGPTGAGRPVQLVASGGQTSCTL